MSVQTPTNSINPNNQQMVIDKALAAKNKSVISPINAPEYEGLRQKLKVIYHQNPKML